MYVYKQQCGRGDCEYIETIETSNMDTFPIQHYDMSRLLGNGAYGAVVLYTKSEFRLSPDSLPKEVAVKVFEPRQTASLEKEIVNYRRVDHPNIVKLFGTCQLDRGRRGLVMEVFEDDLYHYVDSPDSEITRPCGVLPAMPILLQLARALKYLREIGIVHRDVKPENILVRKTEGGEIQVNLHLLFH